MREKLSAQCRVARRIFVRRCDAGMRVGTRVEDISKFYHTASDKAACTVYFMTHTWTFSVRIFRRGHNAATDYERAPHRHVERVTVRDMKVTLLRLTPHSRPRHVTLRQRSEFLALCRLSPPRMIVVAEYFSIALQLQQIDLCIVDTSVG